MTTDTQTRLREIEEISSRASDGPWISNEAGEIFRESDECIIAQVFDNPDDGTDGLGDEQSDWNKALIVHARTDIPFLLQLIAELRAENEKMKHTLCNVSEKMADVVLNKLQPNESKGGE